MLFDGFWDIIILSMALQQEDKIIEVAKYFIKRSQEDSEKDPSRKIDALKLQKLLYYAKAWNLVLNKGHKIFPDSFQAWVHGPANPKVYHHFQRFDFSAKHPEISKEKFESITDKEKNVLEIVWFSYGKFDGKYLEMLTHAESPWLNARNGLNQKDISQNIISDDSMKIYYEQRLKETSGV
jgi:uncharacterized phage-associated protein